MDSVELNIPEILQMPDKLYLIIEQLNNYRYFLLEGGRGGGKTQGVGRFILYLAEKYKLRVVCGRETQTSIAESVYSVLTDLINKYNLYFDVLASKVTHKETGTDINFRGFREQGRFNIQGMEGIDIVWIDEGQAITKQTLDVLIPTIRKDKAKVFFTMNRHIEHDPVFEEFAGRPDCLHIHINYDENKYCTEALRNEAAICKAKSIQDYNHIWLGQPLTQTEDALFGYQELVDTKHNKHIATDSYGMRLAGFDVARFGDDKCTAIIIQQMGALNWEVVYVDEWEKQNLNFTTGRILSTCNEQSVDRAAVDIDGLGSGPFDTLSYGRRDERFVGFTNPTLGSKVNKDYGNPRTVFAYKLRELVSNGHMVMTEPGLIRELTTLKYTYDHQQRKVLISKKVMKDKYSVKSPNKADGLIYAVSLIGDVITRQARQYFKQPAYSQEGDILADAGIR